MRVVLFLTLVWVSHCYPQTGLTPDDQYALGAMYLNGQGATKDYAKAAIWLR
jgi:hypothetical protein